MNRPFSGNPAIKEDDASQLRPWTPQERETFFAAIERHRRAVWQVGAASQACIFVLGLIVAILLCPLFYAVLALVLDTINLVVPMPDLMKSIMDGLDPVLEHPETLHAGRWIYLTFIAALPGLVVMAYVVFTLKRIVSEAEASDTQSMQTRPPNPAALAEQRFANVVQEMALAANIAPPRVSIVDSEGANATVYGENERTATVLASSGLLQSLSRSQMQGVAGHLIGLIANGDVPQGMRIAQTLSTFGFIARLSDGVVDPEAFKRLRELVREAFRRGASAADTQLILELTNPFGDSKPASASRSGGPDKLTWREWIRMPLFGPIVMCGFFGGMVSSFVLAPLLALVWRRRKYMADAIAMQLTRDPDALAGALMKLNGTGTGGALPAWTAHMSLLQSGGRKGLLSGSSVPMFPSIERRLKALGTMGATVNVTERQVPGWVWAVGIPIGLLLAGLLGTAMFLLVWVSVALSGLFTWLPAALIHFALRSFGHS
jgi:Zn-dependent protease with chaperone function